MRRTLFLVPHEVGGIPIFGIGWLLAALVVFIAIRLAWAIRSRDPGVSAGNIIAQESLMWGVFAAIVIFVLPRAEIANIAGDPVGLPVRGYGMFLMLAAVSSVGMAAWRADRAGLGSEMILRLAPWTFIGGLIGARLFYVIQYRSEFLRETWSDTLLAMAAFTQGGLVVYGGFLGGFVASVWAVRRFRGSLWQFGDVIVPCIFIGLMFGRLGCLMNGCCYGGTCAPNPFAVQFPPGSKVYSDQMIDGSLVGIQATPIDGDTANQKSPGRLIQQVTSVATGSLAEQAGIQKNDVVEVIIDPSFMQSAPPEIPAEDARPGLAIVREGELVAQFSPEQLPPRANTVMGTQIISSILAAVMFFTLLFLERILCRTSWYREGILMLLGFISYAILRIILEWVRVDEAGQFGTSFSISQWVSFGVITASVIAMIFRWRTPPMKKPSAVA